MAFEAACGIDIGNALPGKPGILVILHLVQPFRFSGVSGQYAIWAFWQLREGGDGSDAGTLMWFPVVFFCRIALLTHLTAETIALDLVQVKDAASGMLTARFAKTTMCTRYADNTAHALSAVLSHC